jgi:hypothetical protein
MKINICIKVFLIFCFLLLGCESEDFIEKGTCKIFVKGYLNKSFNGEAIFQDVLGLGDTIFFLHLRDIIEPGKNYQFVQFMCGSKPDVGVYSLSRSDTARNLVMEYNDSQVIGTFRSTNGILKIEFTNARELKGWFHFIADESIAIGGGQLETVTITVTGEFYAEMGDIGIILN